MPRTTRLTAFQRSLLTWHAGRGLQAPWRESGDPYQCLVAAVMAQQTQMSRVLPAYERFVAAFPTVEALAAATPGQVIRVWAGMGYNQRAVRLHRAAKRIAAQGWPRNAAALAQIDGIGPFTAAIIASFAFGAPAACVDTNVRRVLGRITGDEAITPARLQALAGEMLPPSRPARWNQAIMDYGATICTQRPKCGECVIAAHCASRERYATPARVADTRASYRARRAKVPRTKEPKFEGSPRYFRGRIIDALRELQPGRSVPLDRLPSLIANGHTPPSAADARAMAEALASQGLAVIRRNRIALPE